MHIQRLVQQMMAVAVAALVAVCFQAATAKAMEHGKKKEDKIAILLVTFGTSVEKAQASFTNIEKRVKAAFPGTEVRWAYTSNIIRKKLAKEEGKQIDSPEMALARLMDEGYTKVAVQSLHMIPGAEFHEINANARLFGQMVGGIEQVKVSLPLLISDETMEQALKIITTKVVPKERKAGEAVVFMGHGTHHPTDAMYSALMYKAQQMDANLYVGTVEGHPTFEEIRDMLMAKKIKKAYLIPFMTVAGDHAMNDMAGDEPDSWKSQLAKAGIESVPVMKGLGEVDAIVDMWIAQLKVAMAHL
ncbi:sirohydrochlorin cobaltochelatase [Desulfobulbus propionicus]|nr:sirohydrochlorin cobaltochelatase [Desulfobulbus propionicus]